MKRVQMVWGVTNFQLMVTKFLTEDNFAIFVDKESSLGD